jgi:hypothetical protein
MEKHVSASVRELDKAVSLIRIVPLHFAPNRLGGWFFELWFDELQCDLGIAPQILRVIGRPSAGVNIGRRSRVKVQCRLTIEGRKRSRPVEWR